MSDDERKALEAADAIILEHGPSPHTHERYRLVLALAYLKGSRDGLAETTAIADAAFARLAHDLSAVAP